MNELVKRLRLIETCISLEDHSLIAMQLPILKSLSGNDDTSAIIELLEVEEYAAAQQAISSFLSSSQGVIVCEDAEASAIRLELKQYELKLQTLLTQRDEAQNRIDDFNRDYHFHLGALLVRILSLKEDIAAQTVANELKYYRWLYKTFEALSKRLAVEKQQRDDIDIKLNKLEPLDEIYQAVFEKYSAICQSVLEIETRREKIRQKLLDEYSKVKTKPTYQEFEDSKQAADEFEQETEEVSQSVVAHLDDEQKKRLKSLYRKASKLVHPDIVSDEIKDKAHDFMVEVNRAYQAQDIERLERVLLQIESGGEIPSFSMVLSGKEALLEKVVELKTKCSEIQNELFQIEQSEHYRIILGLGDSWEAYFGQKQQELEALMAELESNLDALMDSSSDSFKFDFDGVDKSDERCHEHDRSSSSYHEVTGFWRRGHWRGHVWVRGHWVQEHTRYC